MILKKPLAAALLLAGAAGGPYVLYETDAGQAAQSTAGQALGVATGNQANHAIHANAPAYGTIGPGGSAIAGYAVPNTNTANNKSWWNPFSGSSSKQNTLPQSQPTVTVTQINSLSEVLRFDIPPAWVMQHFPIVNTGLGDTQLDGFRVPLVTGTRPDDLVGALTYYFDRFQRVQRISLHAVTGDPTRLIQEIQQGYRLQQQPALGGGLYTTSWNGAPTNILHIAPATVITADQQNARFQVFLELNQPGLQYGPSSEALNLLQAGARAQRW
jgi:hypothetical protein